MVDGGLRKREEVCVCVRLQGVFVFGYELQLRLVTLVFCQSSQSSNFRNCERLKTGLWLWSSMVLGISGLGQSWSSPVSVFFQSWDWTSKHYQLPCFCRYLKTEKDWSRPVATSLLSCHVLDLTHAHIYLMFGPWIIKNGQELVEIWPKTFLYAYFVVNLPDL